MGDYAANSGVDLVVTLGEACRSLAEGVRAVKEIPVVGQIIPTKLLHIRKDSDMALSGEPLKHIKGRLHGCRARVVGVIHHRKSSVGIRCV